MKYADQVIGLAQPRGAGAEGGAMQRLDLVLLDPSTGRPIPDAPNPFPVGYRLADGQLQWAYHDDGHALPMSFEEEGLEVMELRRAEPEGLDGWQALRLYDINQGGVETAKFVDFDTGRVLPAPQGVRTSPHPGIYRFVEEQGIDLCVDLDNSTPPKAKFFHRIRDDRFAGLDSFESFEVAAEDLPHSQVMTTAEGTVVELVVESIDAAERLITMRYRPTGRVAPMAKPTVPPGLLNDWQGTGTIDGRDRTDLVLRINPAPPHRLELVDREADQILMLGEIAGVDISASPARLDFRPISVRGGEYLREVPLPAIFELDAGRLRLAYHDDGNAYPVSFEEAGAEAMTLRRAGAAAVAAAEAASAPAEAEARREWRRVTLFDLETAAEDQPVVLDVEGQRVTPLPGSLRQDRQALLERLEAEGWDLHVTYEGTNAPRMISDMGHTGLATLSLPVSPTPTALLTREGGAFEVELEMFNTAARSVTLRYRMFAGELHVADSDSGGSLSQSEREIRFERWRLDALIQQAYNPMSWTRTRVEGLDLPLEKPYDGRVVAADPAAALQRLLERELDFQVRRVVEPTEALILRLPPNGEHRLRRSDPQRQGGEAVGHRDFTAFTGMNIQSLPGNLEYRVPGPVVDETGLQGEWDFELPRFTGESRAQAAAMIRESLGLEVLIETRPVEFVIVEPLRR